MQVDLYLFEAAALGLGEEGADGQEGEHGDDGVAEECDAGSDGGEGTGKVWETVKLAVQCKKIATPTAAPRTRSGKSFGKITHTVGPQVAAKERMKPAGHSRITMAAGSVGLDGWGRRREETPSTTSWRSCRRARR